MQLTLIPRGTRVDGLVETAHDLTVEGRMDGRIEIGGVLVVAAGATCRAAVRARQARIAGEVMGDVVCSAGIEVLPGGRVVGDLRAPEIEVDAQAFVDGRVDLPAALLQSFEGDQTLARLEVGSDPGHDVI